ncbi:MAG TPA: cytochrome C [Candidatus Krumholzibacteria bacterium]|jgi:thiosulfate dehydrogenase
MKTFFAVGLAAIALVGLGIAVHADEFTKEDAARWQAEYMTRVEAGRALWVSADLGTNGVVCAQCHPNGANTHPETYPKFQQQLGRVIALREMINWCILNPLEGEPLDVQSPEMVAIEAYLAWERRGVELSPGKH